MAISFDPWSAGKRPLNAEFVPSLAAKAEKLFGNDPAKAHDMLDQLRETNKDAFMTVEDTEGVAQARAEVTKGQLLAQDFAKACSLCRHGKFGDVEEMMNQPDWNVPIDYQDDMGNTLLHVVSQNGNRRLVKLCLRRGANLNIQNLTGQTALHFAFGYGYVEVGEYLVSKGADDSIRNGDNLTAYEGLGARELALL
jgi:ankyrin repeat protein